MVLGSTQPDAAVDRERADRSGVEVVRRRSGGGAVWLAPGGVTWVDVVVPADDPNWEPDVGRAMERIGEAWVQALTASGHSGGLVHRGPLLRTPWSSLVCFAGLGPGEVTLPDGQGGRVKVVGISQRRTRQGARFQCALLHRWEPGPLLEVLALTDAERSRALAELAAPYPGTSTRPLRLSVDPVAVVSALADALDGSLDDAPDDAPDDASDVAPVPRRPTGA